MYISAYYFRAQLYTIVPSQVRSDLQWMADHGTNAVVLGLLEQDLFAARENIDIICAAAQAVGLAVWVTPSRWGNQVAGCPKVPSILCATNHDCWARKQDGSPWQTFLGPIASVHHPAVYDYFCTALGDIVTSWPIAGILWDEPKALHVKDHSDHARAALGDAVDDPVAQMQAQADFFGRVNSTLRSQRSDCRTALFVYGHCPVEWITACSRIDPLDQFGCDGRPWALADGGPGDSTRDQPIEKSLIDHGPRFIAAARKFGKQAYALAENHGMPGTAIPLLERRLPEVFAQGWDHLTYYYFPRSCDEPERAMAVLGAALRSRAQ